VQTRTYQYLSTSSTFGCGGGTSPFDVPVNAAQFSGLSEAGLTWLMAKTVFGDGMDPTMFSRIWAYEHPSCYQFGKA